MGDVLLAGLHREVVLAAIRGESRSEYSKSFAALDDGREHRVIRLGRIMRPCQAPLRDRDDPGDRQTVDRDDVVARFTPAALAESPTGKRTRVRSSSDSARPHAASVMSTELSADLVKAEPDSRNWSDDGKQERRDPYGAGRESSQRRLRSGEASGNPKPRTLKGVDLQCGIGRHRPFATPPHLRRMAFN